MKNTKENINADPGDLSVTRPICVIETLPVVTVPFLVLLASIRSKHIKVSLVVSHCKSQPEEWTWPQALQASELISLSEVGHHLPSSSGQLQMTWHYSMESVLSRASLSRKRLKSEQQQ